MSLSGVVGVGNRGSRDDGTAELTDSPKLAGGKQEAGPRQPAKAAREDDDEEKEIQLASKGREVKDGYQGPESGL